MTKPIRLHGIVTEDRRLALDLPSEIPAGPVEVVIEPVEPLPTDAQLQALTPDRARAQLTAAGALGATRYAPDDAVPLTTEERETLGRRFASLRALSTLIDEERGAY